MIGRTSRRERAPATASAGASHVPWHARTVEACLTELRSRFEGLTDAEAGERLALWGANEIARETQSGALARFGRQLDNPLLYVLLGASVITAILQHWTDTGVILGVVVINAVVGHVQEGRAEKALHALRALLAPMSQVVRDGEAKETAARLLVPGDVVLLSAGDRVPADLRLMECRNLEIEESILTGESVPVAKAATTVGETMELPDRCNIAHAGTLVTRGVGRGVACATGEDTELGRISEALHTIEPIRTPLLQKFARLGRQLSYLIILLAAAIAGYGILLHDHPVNEMLIAAVGIAVAAIPEGLPAVVTITLAIGVQAMARRGTIVRRLPAVETLGEVTVICSDKTGTLTRNEMTVRAVELPAGSASVTGVGYAPHGEIRLEGLLDETGHDQLRGVLQAGLNCNDARLIRHNGDWHVNGDPTEGALLALAGKGGLHLYAPHDRLTRLDVIPFQSEQRFMATLHQPTDRNDEPVVFVKGAPETVLSMCRDVAIGSGRCEPLDEIRWRDAASRHARAGRRVLALATTTLARGTDELDPGAIQGRLSLLGFVAVTDPPREQARAALDSCRTAGIRVKMITGDHVETALAIAQELGLAANGRAVAGHELDRLDDAEFAELARDVDVFARTTPEHKLRLVEALQSAGEIVAMTGDGVNDAPALKRAAIGVAMGGKGTEAAKEASEMVLADDNFDSIIQAIEIGRSIDDNIKKSVIFLLPTSIAEALMIAAAILVGYELPITPLQVLWVNMITAITLGLALAFEHPEADIMLRLPRPPNEPLLSQFALWRCCFVSLLILAGVLTLFVLERTHGASLEYARTVAVNALVWFEGVYLISSRRLVESSMNASGLCGNPAALLSIGIVAVLQGLFTYTRPFGDLFEAVPLDARSWPYILTAGVVLFLAVEAEKFLRARRRRLPVGSAHA